MKKANKVTLADISTKLNVSIVTVSKALANKKGVSEGLSREINQLADKMGYLKKNHVDKHRSSTGNIGILIPSRFFSKNTSFYWMLYNAVSKELMRNGYYCILEQLSDENEFDLTLPHMVLDNKVDGIIVLGQLNTDYAYYFINHYYEFIFMDFYINDAKIDTVITDNYYSEYLMTHYLISLGHTDMRFVGSIRATTSISDRFMGFAKAMFESGHSINPEDIIEDRNQHGLSIPIQLPEKLPTAFVCNCDETAVHVINALGDRGIKVPQDISVAGFDNYVTDSCFRPALTTIEVPFASTAGIATDLIIRKITGRPYTPGRHVVSGKLIIRDSVRKIM
jgi:LacI family transcriptional regulator